MDALVLSPSTTGILSLAAVSAGTGAANVYDAYQLSGSYTDTAINSAIGLASAAGGGIVVLRPGTWMCSSSVLLKDNVAVIGYGAAITILKASTGLTTAVVLARSADTVTDCVVSNLAIDGDYTGTALSLNGIQATSCARLVVESCKITNVYNIGVLIQTSASDCTVRSNLIQNVGLGNAANGFGILFKQATHCYATGNRIFDARGMSIGANTAATDLTISGNYLDKTNATSFENIGITSDCSRAVITANHSINSKDNGISCSADRCTVAGNVIDSPRFHGVALASTSTVVVGNVIRNIGQANDAQYAGVALTGITNCVVSGNRIYDDQGSPTMAYGIKEVTTAGGHVYAANRITGTTTSNYLLLSNTSSTVREDGVATLTYGVTVNTDASTGRFKKLVVTDTVAFTIANPSNAFPGATLTYDITNSSGGSMGAITWGAKFKTTTFTNPASTKRVTISFYYDATNWVQVGPPSGDI